MPDKESAMAIAATGIVNGTITVDQVVELLTPAEMDQAVKKTPLYHARIRAKTFIVLAL